MDAFKGLSIQELLRATNTGKVVTQAITIEGELKNRSRFTTVIRVRYNPDVADTEQAIINHFGSQAATFHELCAEQGWVEAYWLYWNREGMSA